MFEYTENGIGSSAFRNSKRQVHKQDTKWPLSNPEKPLSPYVPYIPRHASARGLGVGNPFPILPIPHRLLLFRHSSPSWFLSFLSVFFLHTRSSTAYTLRTVDSFSLVPLDRSSYHSVSFCLLSAMSYLSFCLLSYSLLTS